MTAGTGHDEVRDLLPAAALEILDGEELRRVVAHTRECAECAELLDEYRSVAFALTDLLPPSAPPRSGALRARLLARAREERQGAAETPGRPRITSVVNMWMGWAVAAGMAGVLLVHHAVHRPLVWGWVATGALALLLVVIGGYARIQRSRVSALRDRVTALESVTTRRSEGEG
ncbi:MAG: zf-HC2 domain-containing protein [Gemmatimonadales bacterium]|nr:zf-HC2 domain-containing protein [Gemmatimonadales bacterium]MBA3556398.1 zf-HC2 domain-containing protein [Gemmatimonadales bacterium]